MAQRSGIRWTAATQDVPRTDALSSVTDGQSYGNITASLLSPILMRKAPHDAEDDEDDDDNYNGLSNQNEPILQEGDQQDSNDPLNIDDDDDDDLVYDGD